MNDVREIALDTLNEVFYKDAYSNIILNHKLNSSGLEERDKALVTEIVYGTIKYKYTIDKILDSFLKSGTNKLDKQILNILRIGVYQIKYLDRIPDFAAVNECVELAKKKSFKFSKLVNGVLRNFIRNKDLKIDFKSDIKRLSFEYSFPEWMVELFVKQYGKESTEHILMGLNSVPPNTVRVNNLKTNYDEVWENLETNEYNIQEGKVCPEAIQIIKGRSIERNPFFREGHITVQDESAMLVAPSMELEDNMVVLDLCSAPGGKTTHIAEIMNNTGIIHAFDIHTNKLTLIKQNTERLGITNIKLDTMDASIFNKDLANKADRVLIDVPCSGLGIIRKKPEIKWNKTNKDLKSLIPIQRNIMKNAAQYVKPGGIILYSTCTLNKEENEKNINWFLENFKEFKLEPLFYGNIDNMIYSEMGTVTILPDDNMDGFFIAKLRKQG